MGTMDPTFNPVITDDSAAFSQKAVQAMEKERSQMQLDDSYQLLAQMTDYKDSPSCKEKQQCSLTEAKDAFREGANKQVMSSQADSLIKISRIWADFCGTVAKLAMRQPFVLFKGLTFQKLCLPGAFRPGDHHNKMLRPGLCVVHASPQYL